MASLFACPPSPAIAHGAARSHQVALLISNATTSTHKRMTMTPFLLTLIFTTFLFIVAANGACEQELTDLNACIDNDCHTCIAVDGGVAWTSCSEINTRYCDSIQECSDACGSCMDMYQVWATCYVDSITHVGDDCQLDCNGDERMDETTSSAPVIMTKYLLVLLLLLVVFVAA